MKTAYKRFEVAKHGPLDELAKQGDLHQARQDRRSIAHISGEVRWRQEKMGHLGRRVLVESVIFKLNEDIRQAELLLDSFSRA